MVRDAQTLPALGAGGYLIDDEGALLVAPAEARAPAAWRAHGKRVSHHCHPHHAGRVPRVQGASGTRCWLWGLTARQDGSRCLW